MFGGRYRQRRADIRKKCPERGLTWERLKSDGRAAAIAIAIVFCITASGIMMMRDRVVPYRPGQFVPHAIVSRVTFTFKNKDRLVEAQKEARESRPRIYKSNGDLFAPLEDQLLKLPDQVAAIKSLDELDKPLSEILDASSLPRLQQYATEPFRAGYVKSVKSYIKSLRDLKLVILPAADRQLDLNKLIELRSPDPAADPITLEAKDTLVVPLTTPTANKIHSIVVVNFVLELQPKILTLTERALQPTHLVDEVATTQAKNRAADMVPSSAGDELKPANMVLVQAGKIEDRDWQLLKAENDEFIRTLDQTAWKWRFGIFGMVAIITVVLAGYAARFQPKVIHNNARAGAIVLLMLAMLLLAEVAGIGSSSFYFFGLVPTILVASILATAYDQRFAMGVGSMHAVLVTLALGQGAPFFLILWVGVLTCCFLLDDIRTRSKLIEVGGVTAIAMIVATGASGFVSMDPIEYIGRNCLYAGAAGLAVGFIVLGILPFIEKAFRITTSMTLLELADASQPLLRRLALEAPGTYNHSLQVANLSEEAAESIRANSLMCRVGSYYHDVGKINKAEYFVENQMDGHNRHINLSPSVSLLIIIGHVKDGIEMAKEYNLPTSLFPFIQQHHGTTLVEYFYHQARNQQEENLSDGPAISEMQYRYPGPKPRSREVAIVMLADAVESATRAMSEPTASRIESLVHDLAMKRFLDGQFEECDLTLRELELVEKSLVKTLLGIYHGRIAYPSASPASAPATAIKTA